MTAPLCKTCQHLTQDGGVVICQRNIPKAPERVRCSEYRLDPATEPAESDEPADLEW